MTSKPDVQVGFANGRNDAVSPADRRVLVFFPTYNEAGNVERLVRTIREFVPEAEVLVVDDASPDGTGRLLDRLSETTPGVTVIHRPGKLGLGSAHKLAMLFARDRGFDVLITMDADFSHHPKYLPRFLELLEGAEFVTGSRYTRGGRCDYGFSRTLISRIANFLAKVAVGLPLEENTTMYRGFTRSLLQRLNIQAIHSEGYSFAVESLHQVALATDKLVEFPIHFENRAAGASKISKAEIFKAVVTIHRLGLSRVFAADRPTTAIEDGPTTACCACGGTHHLELYPAKEKSRGHALRDASPYSCATHSSRSHGQVLRCLGCGLVFINPTLSAAEVESEYRDAVDPVYLANIAAREATFRRNLAAVRRYIAPGDRVLEVGSYCGAFLKTAREEGIDIVGLEPSVWAAEASARVVDAPVIVSTLGELRENFPRFDVVVAWDVLEHFADPVEELRRVNSLLPDGGTLLFSTLMIDNWFPKVLGKHWPWLMDMHLFYFTESTIKNVLESTGFEIVESGKYCHIVTLQYLLTKLGTLGVPAVSALADRIHDRGFSKAEIPFRFGDIKLFVCRKKIDVPPRSSVKNAGLALGAGVNAAE